MGNGSPVTYDECREESAKHATRKGLRRASFRVYRAIHANGWTELLGHMTTPKQVRIEPGSAEEVFIITNYATRSLVQLAEDLGFSLNVTNREVNRVLSRHGMSRRPIGTRTDASRMRQLQIDEQRLRLRSIGLTAREIGARLGNSKSVTNKAFERLKRSQPHLPELPSRRDAAHGDTAGVRLGPNRP